MNKRKNSNQPAGNITTGSCACGNVRFQITGELRDVVNCHCDPCRRWTGHFMAGTSAQIENFFFESDSTLTWWERTCLLYTSPSPRDKRQSRMPSSA